MDEFSTEQVSIEPITQQFLDNINSQSGPPIYELSPTEARNVLTKVQDINITKLPADIEDLSIPVGPKGKTNIRIVRPKGNQSRLPAIMYFHGGGWILGDKDIYDRLVREISNETHAAVIFVDFDRSPEAKYPIAIEEAYAATKYIGENSDDLNINATKLAVVGDSVGGNMAAVVTLLAKERCAPKIDYQILFYPVTDANFETESYNKFANGFWLSKEAMKWFWNAYLHNENESKNYIASPLLASLEQLKGLPPALIITNEYDVLRNEGEAYAHKLIKAGVDVTAIRLLGMIHDCVMLNALADTPAVRAAMNLAVFKLRQVFSS